MMNPRNVCVCCIKWQILDGKYFYKYSKAKYNFLLKSSQIIFLAWFGNGNCLSKINFI